MGFFLSPVEGAISHVAEGNLNSRVLFPCFDGLGRQFLYFFIFIYFLMSTIYCGFSSGRHYIKTCKYYIRSIQVHYNRHQSNNYLARIDVFLFCMTLIRHMSMCLTFLILRLWPLGQKHKHFLGACWKCIISGPKKVFWIKNRISTRYPGGLNAY